MIHVEKIKQCFSLSAEAFKIKPEVPCYLVGHVENRTTRAKLGNMIMLIAVQPFLVAYSQLLQFVSQESVGGR